MKPIYEDESFVITPPDSVGVLVIAHDYGRLYIKKEMVEAMAKSLGLIPTLSDTDEVLPEAIFN